MTKGSHSIELDVSAHAVWELVVGPGKRDWYYRLTPRGEFAHGAHISWVDAEGKAAEESDVVNVEPGKQLVLRSRFVFAPGLAAAAPHTVTWEVTGDGDRSAVRMSWEAEGPASNMLASEARSQLEGLRLAADPAARAELARLDRIGEVEIRDVGPALLSAYLDFFDKRLPRLSRVAVVLLHRDASAREHERRRLGSTRRGGQPQRHDRSDQARRGHGAPGF